MTLHAHDRRVVLYIEYLVFYKKVGFGSVRASALARKAAGIPDSQVRTLTKIIKEAQK